MRLFLFVLSLFLPFAAAARDVDLTTRLGPARIVDGPNNGRALMFGDTLVALPTNPYLAFIQDRRGDLFLVAVSDGGNACPAHFVWVHATPGDVRTSPAFGTCADLIEVTHDKDTVRVTMPSLDPAAPPVTYIYDGHRLTETNAPRPESGVRAADGWIGRYPFEILQAADYRDRLIAIMGQDGLDLALRHTGIASPMQAEGDWVVGAGCEKVMCPANSTMVALSRSSGAIVVAVSQEGRPTELFGNPDGALPASMVAFLAR